MNSLSSTDGWYDGRPVASASIPLNLRSARSSSPTNTSITRTGLSSQIQSSRHSGNSVLWWRSVPSTKRFIRFLRKLRRNHNPRITSLSVFLHNQDPQPTLSESLLYEWVIGARGSRQAKAHFVVPYPIDIGRRKALHPIQFYAMFTLITAAQDVEISNISYRYTPNSCTLATWL